MKSNNRITKIDFLRGIAILSMILTHVVALIYKGNSSLMGGAILWGVDISYFIFLFLFAYIYGIKIAKNKVDDKKEAKRASSIYIAYLFLAFFIWIFLPQNIDWIGTITFRVLPEFIDFLPSFSILILLILLFKPLITKLLNKQWLFITIAILLFALSKYLYTLTPLNESVLILKANFVGHESLHTFGILSYIPITVLGLVAGNNQVKKIKINWGLIFLISIILMPVLKQLGLSDWERWAPSVYFHLIGLTFTSLVFFGYEYIPKIFNKGLKVIEWIGRRPLDFYIYHLIILIPLVLIINAPIASELITVLIYIATMFTIKTIIKWKETN